MLLCIRFLHEQKTCRAIFHESVTEGKGRDFFLTKNRKRGDDTVLTEFKKTTNTSPNCHQFWKMLIGGLRCYSEQIIKGFLWGCQYKGNITKPRWTYLPRRPHLPCWCSGHWGSLWRSRPGPPPCKIHTFKSF